MEESEKARDHRREALERAIEYHGHMCFGQVLGIHLAEKGMEALGTRDPKKIIVYVENDRCIADAIQILTGTRLGRRTMKLVNYGKMAATFIHTDTGAAYRVWVNPKSSVMIGDFSKDREERHRQYGSVLEAPTDDVVSVRRVKMDIPPDEMPGKPRRTVWCAGCGEKVMDGKDVPGPDGPRCLACANGAYYSIVGDDTHEA